MEVTNQQYTEIVEKCKHLFLKKATDYGTSWRVLRPISFTDQIYIKAFRIRNIQETGVQKIHDNIASEFIGIINYAIIGLIQLKINNPIVEELTITQVEQLYDEQVNIVYNTMLNKNHDYGEAWRNMHPNSLTDLILVKLIRIKQIIFNDGKTLISEGIDANLIDIMNYAIFSLILINEI